MTERFTEDEVRELASVFYERMTAGHLLDAAGLGRPDHPQNAGTSLLYWREVHTVIGAGGFPAGRRRILAEAVRQYPANAFFRRGLTRPGVTAPAPSADGA